MGCGASGPQYEELRQALDRHTQALERNTKAMEAMGRHREEVGPVVRTPVVNYEIGGQEAKDKNDAEGKGIVEKKDEDNKKPLNPAKVYRTTKSGIPILKPYKNKAKKLAILHFNDVYNLVPVNERAGAGVARFFTLVEKHRHLDPLILFSGDCFAPSVMSTITKGSQMPPTLNKIGVHVSMYGNHDFDYGEQNAIKLSRECDFPWLLGNIVGAKSGKPIGEALECVIVEHAGMKIGIFACAEDWTTLMPLQPEDGLKYHDFIEYSRKMVKRLQKEKTDLIIAITHSRLPNDELLAKEVQGIDLILGGHDHLYAVKQVEPHGQIVVKSGSDFQDLTIIEVLTDIERLDSKKGLHGAHATFITTRHSAKPEVKKHEGMQKFVTSITADVEEKFSSVIGHIGVDFDCTFQTVRTGEAPVGNFLADLMRQAYHSDIGYMVGGGIRGNAVFNAGPFTYKNILAMLPFQDPCVSVSITGKVLVNCLEHGLASYPKLDGRFPHVSGIRLVFDPSKPSGSRVQKVFRVEADGTEKPLEMDSKYSVATRSYIVHGGDDYDFSSGELVVDDENGHALGFLLRNFFWKVDSLNRLKRVQDNLKEDADAAARYGLERMRSLRKLRVASKDAKAPEIEQYIIAPKIEGRCMTIETEKKKKSHHEPLSPAMKAVGSFRGMTERVKTARVLKEAKENHTLQT
ncbi:hypothetical protein AAMO2058_000613300 [Amorphochlora amoebiformis]